MLMTTIATTCYVEKRCNAQSFINRNRVIPCTLYIRVRVNRLIYNKIYYQ